MVTSSEKQPETSSNETGTLPSAGDTPLPKASAAQEPAVRTHAPSPRWMKAMAIVRWAMLAAVSGLAIHSVVTHWGHGSHAASEARPDRFYCSMHPQIRSADPGTCPICHMDLVPIPADRQQGPSPDSPASTMGAAVAPPASAAPSAPGSLPGLAPITLSIDRQKSFGIVVAPVTEGTLGDRLRIPASLEAPRSGIAEVRVRAAGFIEGVSVRETGIRVKKGQPLAFMYSPEIYRASEELLAAHRLSEGPAASAMGNTAADMVSAARRGLELWGISGAEIDEMIKKGRASKSVAIRAPQSGVVTKSYAVLGMRAMPEAPLYEIADLSRIWVVASVQERDLDHVKPGMVADVTFSNRPDEARKAKVDLIEPDVSPVTRAARVRLTLENKDYQLRPGQYGEVSFELPEQKVLSVPRDAVVDTGKTQYVFVAMKDGRFEPRAVKPGALAGDRLQIVSGVRAGEEVVTRGSFLVDSESRLQASLQTGAAAATPEFAGEPAPPPDHVHVPR